MKQSDVMTQDAAARIQSAEAKANGGKVKKDSFAARAQRTMDKNTNPPKTSKTK